MTRIFISSPYTIGDAAMNVKRQMDAASALIKLGYAPFWPLQSHFLHMVHPEHYEVWMTQDFEWLKQCHGVLRLPGESSGADRETEHAKQYGIPVFHTIDEVISHFIRQPEDSYEEGLPF